MVRGLGWWVWVGFVGVVEGHEGLVFVRCTIKFEKKFYFENLNVASVGDLNKRFEILIIYTIFIYTYYFIHFSHVCKIFHRFNYNYSGILLNNHQY